mmetsp:Transcript_117023/g.331178  ORF Transcript_117023/g.331178 Transcript_117023/m.331178 type:complete len:232 (-) Transcript_117023:156-851(-)
MESLDVDDTETDRLVGADDRHVRARRAPGAVAKATSSPYSGAVQAELLRGAVVRLYYSRFTAYLYIATFVLAGCLLVANLGMDTPLRDAPRVLVMLEALVSLSLFLEVVLRAVALGREYVRSCANLVDGAVAAASVFLMFWAAPQAVRAHNFEGEKEDVELSESLVMGRIIFQFVRVLLIAQHARRSKQAKASEDVTFSSLIGAPDLNLDFAVLLERQLQEQRRSQDFDGL